MARKQLNGVAKPQEFRIGLQIARQLVPLSLVIIFLWFAKDHIPPLDSREILMSLQQVAPWQWLAASLATGVSFWAIGRYDSVMHGLLGTGISKRVARQSGITAIAIAQFTGFGVITGALVRWRLLPDLTLARAFRVSLTVSVSFLAGWAVVTAAVVLLAGFDQPAVTFVAHTVLWLAIAVISLLVWRPGFVDRLPTLLCLKSVFILVLIDTAFAALALFVLLPAQADISPFILFAAFLVALGAGLIGGTPGGVGPFELCLIALLPQIPDPSLLASALAFRIIYNVMPAMIAALVLLIGLRPDHRNISAQLGKPSTGPYLPPKTEKLLWAAPQAEVNLIRQGDFSPLFLGDIPVAIAALAGQSLIMLGNPIDQKTEAFDTLTVLTGVANQLQRRVLVYKCSARTALAGRQMGWQVMPVSKEAWLRPATFSTQGAGCRQLRRSLRKAEKSGVKIVEAGRELPLALMTELSKRWCANQGGEKRFSMGVFNADYVKCQRVFLAYRGCDLVAFASFHETRNEWALDLMRHDAETPAGTMHSLVRTAIQSAAACQCNRLSLAAVPHLDKAPYILGKLHQMARQRHQADGLTRFKTSFQPNWSTLYALAPNRRSLVQGFWSTYRKINKTS